MREGPRPRQCCARLRRQLHHTGHGGCGSTRERAAVARRVGAALARVALLLCLCSAAAEASSWTAAALRARALLDDAGEVGAMASRKLDWSYI